MTKNFKENTELSQQKKTPKKYWSGMVLFFLNIFITIPVFIIFHQNIIDLEWFFQLDRILIFIAILSVFQLLLRLMRKIVLVCIAVYLLVLTYGTLSGGYSFQSIFDDYRVMIFAMAENPYPQDIIISKLLPFPNRYKIANAIEYNNPKVRNFALQTTTKHFKDLKGYQKYRQTIQCFAVFKEIQRNWNYVNDPKGREYIASASESLEHFSGDCEDHAVLMAACIRAIGGTPRLIHTKAHIYPEMLIGSKSDLETVVYLIKEVLFTEESKDKEIHYHIDERNQVWLNLDYTAKYPGGPFMSEEILGALTLD